WILPRSFLNEKQGDFQISEFLPASCLHERDHSWRGFVMGVSEQLQNAVPVFLDMGLFQFFGPLEFFGRQCSNGLSSPFGQDVEVCGQTAEPVILFSRERVTWPIHLVADRIRFVGISLALRKETMK